MQQIYTRTPMPKCDFNIVAKQHYWNHTPAWVFSCKFAACFQNTFSEEQIWVAASAFCVNFMEIHSFRKSSETLRKLCVFTKFSLGEISLLKRSFWHRCFPVNFMKFQRTPFVTEHLLWLLLSSSTTPLFIYRF